MKIEVTDRTDFLKNIEEGINAYSRVVTGVGRVPVNLIAQDGDVFTGGIKAHYVSDQFYVSWLYVTDALRGKGLGRQLMVAAEKAARDVGCVRIYVDTTAFQAPDFYKKLGYIECARIAGFYAGHDRIFFVKEI